MRRMGYPEHGNGLRQMLGRLVGVYRSVDETFPEMPNAVTALAHGLPTAQRPGDAGQRPRTHNAG
ncbi:MAG TPA: hypothetical protein VI452_12930 [Marmoricola sp.]